MSRVGEEPRIETGNPARWRLIAGFAMLVALFAFVVAVWFAFHESGPAASGSEGSIPIARAPAGPDRERPEEPGGMAVPDRDKSVFDTFKPQAAREHERVERLLPPPERPLPEPVPATPPEPAQQDDSEMAPAPDEPSTLPQVEIAERPEAAPPPSPEATEGEGEAAATGPVGDAPPPPPARPERFAALSQPDPAPPAPAPVAPKPAATPQGDWMVQLAALREEEAARAAWERAKRDAGGLLDGLESTIVRADLGDKGVYYRLRTGDFDSRDAADAFCARLKAKGLGCLSARR